MANLRVLNPVAQTNKLQFKSADRIKELKELSVGLVWNCKPGGNIALRRIAENIKHELGYDFKITEFQDDIPFDPTTIEKYVREQRIEKTYKVLHKTNQLTLF